MKSPLIRYVKRVAKALRNSAPYVVLEVLLPGGTLFALLLLIYQRRDRFAVVWPRPLHVVVAQAPGRPRPKLTLVVRERLASPARLRDGGGFAANMPALQRAA